MLVWLLIGVVEAGKLATDNGFRGKQFGDAEVLVDSPMVGCVHEPEIGVKWKCDTTLGEHPVKVNYMVREGLFTGVYMTSTGHNSCYGVKDILTMAWGVPERPNRYMDEYWWKDMGVYATWNYMSVTGTCSIIVTNLSVYSESDKRAKLRASTAVGDL